MLPFWGIIYENHSRNVRTPHESGYNFGYNFSKNIYCKSSVEIKRLVNELNKEAHSQNESSQFFTKPSENKKTLTIIPIFMDSFQIVHVNSVTEQTKAINFG